MLRGEHEAWDPRGGAEPVLAVREGFLECVWGNFPAESSKARSFLVERVTGGIAVRVTTIQKAQSKKQHVSLWVRCLRAESRKKQGGEANGARSRHEVPDGGF